jgi:hypothetical protein
MVESNQITKRAQLKDQLFKLHITSYLKSLSTQDDQLSLFQPFHSQIHLAIRTQEEIDL